MVLGISLCVMFFVLAFSKRAGYGRPLAFLFSALGVVGFWVLLLLLLGLVAVLIKLFSRKKRLSHIYGDCVTLGITGTWCAIFVAVVGRLLWSFVIHPIIQ